MQFPNLALWLWLATIVLRQFVERRTTAREFLDQETESVMSDRRVADERRSGAGWASPAVSSWSWTSSLALGSEGAIGALGPDASWDLRAMTVVRYSMAPPPLQWCSGPRGHRPQAGQTGGRSLALIVRDECVDGPEAHRGRDMDGVQGA